MIFLTFRGVFNIKKKAIKELIVMRVKMLLGAEAMLTEQVK
jgi:hypothetical protein